jgi:hypothetical protein
VPDGAGVRDDIAFKADRVRRLTIGTVEGST